jgi:hypothetical protein
MAIPALLAAGAALSLPGPTGQVTGIASILAVGAIALLAGHRWGLFIAAAAAVGLLGKVWPIVAAPGTSAWGLVAAWAAIVTAVPGVVLFFSSLPRIVELAIGRRDGRVHRAGTVTFAVAAAAWLLAPGLTTAHEVRATRVASAPTAASLAAAPHEHALGIEPGADRWLERD